VIRVTYKGKKTGENKEKKGRTELKKDRRAEIEEQEKGVEITATERKTWKERGKIERKRRKDRTGGNYRCNRHKNPLAASLPGRSEEMKSCTRHVNKDVNVRMNVMHNKYE
jgi:predicted transglutaminase-like cysteine proteinase